MKKIVSLLMVGTLLLGSLCTFATDNPQGLTGTQLLDYMRKEADKKAAIANQKNTINDNRQESWSDMKVYKDLKSNYWAYDSFKWGVAFGIITGYSDKTIKPENTLTESEFVAMLCRYYVDTYNLKPTAMQGEHWSQGYYEALAKYELPFLGRTDDTVKTSPITRGRVAMITAAQFGFNLTEEQAIYFMYENRLSTGLELAKRTLESYGKDKALKRAEAVTFLKNIKNKNTGTERGKNLTFMGKISDKGFIHATKVGGVAGLAIDTNLVVDFNDFNREALRDLDGKVTTRPIGNGYVEAVLLKWTPQNAPLSLDGSNKYLANYAVVDENEKLSNWDKNMTFGIAQNVVFNYKGVDIPYCKTKLDLRTGDTLFLKFNDIGMGNWTDKKTFMSLMDNLKKFNVRQIVIDEAKKYVDKYGLNQDIEAHDGDVFILSDSKGNSLCLQATRGSVSISVLSKSSSIGGVRVVKKF